ncbi:MAG: rRNA maturation RNase YbeY [Candidatus Omnitrophota bacterium]
MNTIYISNIQKTTRLPRKKIKLWAEEILNMLKIKNQVLSLLFIDDKEIKKLNKIYRDKNSATDVLAFSMREGRFSGVNPEILGDVVISIETARRRARERKITTLKETLLYLIHGILHLLGYRDDSDKEKEKMKAKEKEIFSKLWNEEN